ncbi:6-phospho-3-hexuloisomerase [Bombilactobacillus bombi]|uniref:6-phospho-3-hexuloisomerase n=1 Tax=Bombilactobacillus bombi TaxID=1303590 RepID=UPI000E569BFD|nr:6-phospho-3-hexuloisomerase [Bombilactobacillus bombi]AXX65091.1 6-phospho-3-hexuloisomerase [Bombilactobacillus bombi]
MIKTIMNEINTVMSLVNIEQLKETESLLMQDRKVFVLGAGRSGLIAKGFAMRLMQLGYTVYVIGETITPSIQKNDILFCISGSGETHNIITLAKKAKAIGVTLITVTSNIDSYLSKISNSIVLIPGTTKDNDGAVKSIQLLSTLFDQCSYIILDILCLQLSHIKNISDSTIKSRHTNME